MSRRPPGKSWRRRRPPGYDELRERRRAAVRPCRVQSRGFVMAKFAVILPAAGQSSRFKDKEKKPFALLDGRAVWLRSAELFVTREDVCQCILVVAKEDQETFRRRYGANMA